MCCCRNLLEDLVYVSQADVLVGLHGDTLYWAFFMTKHSSVVEIRPRGFAGPQANQHVKVCQHQSMDTAMLLLFTRCADGIFRAACKHFLRPQHALRPAPDRVHAINVSRTCMFQCGPMSPPLAVSTRAYVLHAGGGSC